MLGQADHEVPAASNHGFRELWHDLELHTNEVVTVDCYSLTVQDFDLVNVARDGRK